MWNFQWNEKCNINGCHTCFPAMNCNNQNCRCVTKFESRRMRKTNGWTTEFSIWLRQIICSQRETKWLGWLFDKRNEIFKSHQNVSDSIILIFTHLFVCLVLYSFFRWFWNALEVEFSIYVIKVCISYRLERFISNFISLIHLLTLNA